MKVNSIKTSIVRKSIKRAQQIVKNTQPKKVGGYVHIGNGRYVFIALIQIWIKASVMGKIYSTFIIGGASSILLLI